MRSARPSLHLSPQSDGHFCRASGPLRPGGPSSSSSVRTGWEEVPRGLGSAIAPLLSRCPPSRGCLAASSSPGCMPGAGSHPALPLFPWVTHQALGDSGQPTSTRRAESGTWEIMGGLVFDPHGPHCPTPWSGASKGNSQWRQSSWLSVRAEHSSLTSESADTG